MVPIDHHESECLCLAWECTWHCNTPLSFQGVLGGAHFLIITNGPEAKEGAPYCWRGRGVYSSENPLPPNPYALVRGCLQLEQGTKLVPGSFSVAGQAGQEAKVWVERITTPLAQSLGSGAIL